MFYSLAHVVVKLNKVKGEKIKMKMGDLWSRA